MQVCQITIATSVDGARETSVSYTGTIDTSKLGVYSLQYLENQANVCMRIDRESVEIEREGDYSLSLRLKQGVTCSGSIGIGGSSGEVQTKTYLLEWKESKDSILLLLKYDLIISGEKQRMKLRLHGKIR